MADDMTRRAVTIRLPEDLYEEASLIANVEGVTMKRLVEQGIESLIKAKTRGDDSLGAAINAVRSHRRKLATV